MFASMDCAWTAWLPALVVSWWWAWWFAEWFVISDCTVTWCFSACWARCALESRGWWCGGGGWLVATGELNGPDLVASCWAAVGAGGWLAVCCCCCGGAFGEADLKLTGELDGEELALVQLVEKFEFEFTTRSEAAELLFKLWADDEFELLFADWDPLFPPCWRCLEASCAFFREPVRIWRKDKR